MPNSVELLCIGNATINVAKTAAMLNVNTAFCGSTDNGEWAVFFDKDFPDGGVTPDIKTGLRFTFNRDSPEAGIGENLIAGAEAVVLDGNILEQRLLAQHILQLANRRGIPVALDTASVSQIREKTEAVLQYSRNYPLIVFMNADECIAFYNNIKKGASIDAVNERDKETLILKEICPVLKYITEGDIFPVIVIKLGSRGAVVMAGGNIYREETFSIIPRNTTGAGDAFCAAFMSAWIRGKSINECAAFGNKVARVILEVPGTRVGSGKFKSLAKILQK